MSVRQATGMYAISLPNGCRSLPVELLPQLERFERIYLWMDDDTPGGSMGLVDDSVLCVFVRRRMGRSARILFLLA